jgi:hypothetical protein
LLVPELGDRPCRPLVVPGQVLRLATQVGIA